MERFPAGRLLDLAKTTGVEALIQTERFRCNWNKPFDWDQYTDAMGFLNDGNTLFALEFPYEFWWLQKSRFILGDEQSGLLQDEFIVQVSRLTPSANMRAVASLGGKVRHFSVYTGSSTALVGAAQRLQ